MKLGDSVKDAVVVVALSGGVDSAVAAALLVEQAKLQEQASFKSVVGVHMSNWNVRDEDADNDSKSSSSSSSHHMRKGNQNLPSRGASKDTTSTGSIYCTSEHDWNDAVQTARHLHIPITRITQLESAYWCHVFEPYVDALWHHGHMGNPDVDCNTHVKFGALWQHVLKTYGKDESRTVQLATGHYARLWHRHGDNASFVPDSIQQAASSSADHMATLDWLCTWGRRLDTSDDNSLSSLLLAGADASKDQSYFLSVCNASVFRHVLFPLGDLCKSKTASTNSSSGSNSVSGIASTAAYTTTSSNEPSNMTVRTLAGPDHFALPVATKRDSMGICFVGKRSSGFANFMANYLPLPRYRLQFVDVDDGQVVHETAEPAHPFFYTPGQGARLSGASSKYFVVDHHWTAASHVKFVAALNSKSTSPSSDVHVISVAKGTHHAALYSDSMMLDSIHWLCTAPPPALCPGRNASALTCLSFRAQCRIRHLQPLVDCTIVYMNHDECARPHYVVQFDVPVRGITRGQVAVFYTLNGLVCLGGGPIAARGSSYWELRRPLPTLLHPSGHNDTSTTLAA